MAGEGDNWIKKFTQQVTERLIKINSAGRSNSEEESSVIIEFINPERTRGRLPNGKEVNTISIGGAAKFTACFKITDGEYICQTEELSQLHTDGGRRGRLFLSKDIEGVRHLYIKPVGSFTYFELDVSDYYDVDAGEFIINAKFFPGGNHLFVGIASSVPRQLKWLVVRDFTTSNSQVSGTFEPGTFDLGTISFASADSPPQPSAMPSALLKSGACGDDSATFEDESDPTLISQFPVSESEEFTLSGGIFNLGLDILGAPIVDFLGSYSQENTSRRLFRQSGALRWTGSPPTCSSLSSTISYPNPVDGNLDRTAVVNNNGGPNLNLPKSPAYFVIPSGNGDTVFTAGNIQSFAPLGILAPAFSDGGSPDYSGYAYVVENVNRGNGLFSVSSLNFSPSISSRIVTQTLNEVSLDVDSVNGTATWSEVPSDPELFVGWLPGSEELDQDGAFRSRTGTTVGEYFIVDGFFNSSQFIVSPFSGAPESIPAIVTIFTDTRRYVNNTDFKNVDGASDTLHVRPITSETFKGIDFDANPKTIKTYLVNALTNEISKTKEMRESAYDPSYTVRDWYLY